MKTMKRIALTSLILLLVLTVAALAGCSSDAAVNSDGNPVIPAEDNYSFESLDVTRAEPDSNIVLDGILDEEAYKDNNWLYLHNDDAGNNVSIAMTSHYGEKGMYFIYDVTESIPIYVNLERSPVMNSCIEMYLASSDAINVKHNSLFEIDMMPTGHLYFRKSNGAYGYTDVTTTNDKMAVLAASTKGGDVNTPECYGYNLELFIPWEYLEWLGVDVDDMKNGYVLINPAHITSFNYSGTNTSLDRYWYHYVQQNGIEFTDVAQYFRFDGNGVRGTVPVMLQEGENCTLSGDPSVIPGMKTVVTIKPDEGYALTSILIDGKEQIQNVSYNEDGSVTLSVRSGVDGVEVYAKAEPVTDGKKTLSGKVVLHSLVEDELEGLLISYTGPKGEKPVPIDEQGRFELADMEQGYYILKVEKEGYIPITRGICLNQDIYTDLRLEYDLFTHTSGTSFIMDDQNDGILYKMSGSGHVMSNVSYDNFTYSVNLKYDEELAKQGKGDLYLQQRSGMRILFSNGKYWHIDMLKEGNKYILQYGKHTGDNSVFNWKTVHTLDAEQVRRYTSEEGIELKIMRQGRYVAVWLGGYLVKVEVLNNQYSTCTAQVGVEAWLSNRTIMEVPFSIVPHSTVYVAGSPFHIPSRSWNISGQYSGVVVRYGMKGGQWLDGQINANDVTVLAKDLSPDTKDYSFAYVFKFSNGQQFRVRLNHTDNDGAYRIQSMGGSTIAPAWKNAYTLTPEEVALVQGDGIEYRVEIIDTTAYVYLDGKEVCTYDLSTVVATGAPSGIEKATAKVTFALDGNLNGTTVVPFKMVDSTRTVTVMTTDTTGGTVVTDKETYKIGETVTLTLKNDEGYYYTSLLLNGEKVEPNWDGTYSFTASENRYEVSATFAPGSFAENADSAWTLTKQALGLLKLESHDTGNSGWLSAAVDGNDISTLVKDADPDAKDFSMIYHFTFSNGETLRLRLNHTDNDGKYRVQVMSGSTLSAAWKNHYTLTDTEAARVQNAGVNFRVVAKGGEALVYIDDVKVATLDLSKVDATGKDSGIADSGVRVQIRMDGNLGQEMEIPFELVDTTTQVVVNIAALTNGTVTADRTNYRLGDTITLTVAPGANYSQKLYVNGNALKLDWKTNTYSFEATEQVYDITGSFEPSLNVAPSDANRWDVANQAHGILNTYYPSENDSWWTTFNGEYRSITVKAKNYLSVADSQDGNGKVGFAVILRVTMDNGKIYAFRVINDKGTYAYDRYGSGGSATGWGGWKNLSSYAADFNGDGVDFKLERTAANKLTLSVNGTVMETYTMAGITADNKVASVSLQHNGNKGQYVEVPFVLKTPTDAPDVQLNIAALTNGKVTPEQDKYQVGDTVTLTIAPDADYSQKLYINGQPLKLDWKTNTCSFVATEEVYNITGSFVPSLNVAPSDANRWDVANQAHGILNTYYPGNNDSWWTTFNGEYRSITVKAKNYLSVADSQDGNGKVGFAVILRVTMDNGKIYAFRVINDKGTYAYDRYGSGGSATGWGGWKNLSSYAADFNGDGVDFKLERTAANKLTLSVNGTVMETYTMVGITADNKVASVSLQHNGNKGQYVEVPFELRTPTDAPDVQLNIAALTNGKVTPEQDKYQVGDTITLTVTPTEGYVQQLYINGQPLKLDWKTNTYSFVATEETYNITGTFVSALSIKPSDANRWDFANQAHGILNTYYPSDNDSWWADISGEHGSITVNAKNYLPKDDTHDGNGKVGFCVALRVAMDNGKTYAFRIYNDKGTYAYSRSAASGSAAGWGGWKALDEAAANAVGSGVPFKLERTGANTLTLSVNGTVVDTYTMDGVTADSKVVSMGVIHYGNKGQKIEIPYTVEEARIIPDVQLNIAEVTSGTVTADKEGYKVGDTVTLTVTPTEGYVQQLYINGQPLKLDWKTNTYSFVATEETYNITGTFVSTLSIKPSDANRWDFANQAHGILNTYYPSDNDSWWADISGEYDSITINAKNYLSKDDTHDGNGKVGFCVALRVAMDNGKTYAFRIYNDKGTYAYSRSAASGSAAGWGGWKALDEAAANAVGSGVPFKLERTGANTLTLSVNGTVVDTYTMDGVTGANKVTAMGVIHYGNKGQKIEIPYTLTRISTAKLNIAEVTNGTVTADKESCKVGETITLTVTPAEGYVQQLYINGQPLKLDWKTNTYSFVATEETYKITGNFVPARTITALDPNRWDFANQAHGVVTTYYPGNNDSWWTDFAGNHNSITVIAKNHLSMEESYEGSANGGGFRIVLRATMDNGKNYAFSIWVTPDKVYAYNHFGGGGSATGWGGAWALLSEKNAAAIDALNGAGASFKLERIDGNHFQISINGTVLETYTIEGVTEANKVVSMGVAHYGNKTTKVEIPFVLG